MDLKLELVPVPVSDVDRARDFYRDRVGFHVDIDDTFGDVRVVQLTPPGSACSIAVGVGTDRAPGSVRGLHLVVTDIHAVRAALADRGLDIEEVHELGAPGKPTVAYAGFADPDGNTWTLQEVLPAAPEQ
jgi:catechol 2,3-dioxygenase-like lactoylglutathione lyase family enzyme